MGGKTAEEQESLRFELAYYMSGQGEAPVLYFDSETNTVHDIYTSTEKPHLLWYENGKLAGFILAVMLSGERFSSIDLLRERAFELAPRLKYSTSRDVAYL